MTQEEFLKILRKYRQGKASQEEIRLIEDWYAAIETEEPSHLNYDVNNGLENQYWQRITASIKADKSTAPAQNVIPIMWWRYTSVAATLILMVFAIYYFNQRSVDRTIASDDTPVILNLKTIANVTSKPIGLILPEGSKILLSPSSSIQYDTLFTGKEREIYLQGEAFFDVHRDTARPFLVYTGDVTTRVLGTSFTVHTTANKDVIVSVKTGKVSVYTKEKAYRDSLDATRVLLPNQQAIYHHQERSVSYALVESPQPVIPIEEVKKMKFEDAPVSEVLEALSKVYNVEINYSSQSFEACTITTSISDGGIYNRLDIICQALGATYSIQETQIVVEGGKGCAN